MDIYVCVGSSCHLKNSKSIIDKLNLLIERNGLKHKVILKGSFCMGLCGENGVSVKTPTGIHSVTEDGVEMFFKDEILSAIDAEENSV